MEAVSSLDRLPLEDVLPNIFSFVGSGQFLFIGSVNRAFHDAYLSLFPSKVTQISVSSNAVARFCMNDFALQNQAYYAVHSTWLEDEDGNVEDHLELDGSENATRLLRKAAVCNFEVLKYLHSIKNTTRFVSEDVWDSSSLICASAAEAGLLYVLQWLRKQNVPWCNETCDAAARSGHLEVLQWCHANGCELYWGAICQAAEAGHLPVVQYLHTSGIPLNTHTCCYAARGGHLHVLQWLRSKGCPWCPQTPANAAGNGHLHVLKWAFYNHCPFDARTCVVAHLRQQRECFEWAVEHGFPLDVGYFEWDYESESSGMEDDRDAGMENYLDDDESESSTMENDWDDDESHSCGMVLRREVL
jgi:hypothetical protein